MTITGVLKRIIDNNGEGEAEPAPIPKPQTDFKCDAEESAFKAALSKVHVKAIIDDDPRLNYRLVRIRPDDFSKFKQALQDRGLLPNPFIMEQVWAVEKEKDGYFEFKTMR